LTKRIQSYFNPFSIVKHFTSEASKAVTLENADLLHWIDALTEISIKAVQKTLPSLANETVNSLQGVGSEYLLSERSITHHGSAERAPGSKVDEVSFTMFYLFQRLELIFDRALSEKIEPVCSNLITALGKIVIDSAKYDLSMTMYPLHYIGKFAKRAQHNDMNIVGEKATCTLLEVSRIIIDEVDLKYQELKDPFFSVIQHLEEIAKETFKQDKTMNINVLIQPFKDLRAMFANEKVATLQDTPIIVADIDRVIAEFNQVELVMKTIPPIQIKEEE
jgi:hypothetical protein